MSHGQFEQLYDVKRRIKELDEQISAAKAEGAVPDLKAYGELKRWRDALATERDALEQRVGPI